MPKDSNGQTDGNERSDLAWNLVAVLAAVLLLGLPAGLVWHTVQVRRAQQEAEMMADRARMEEERAREEEVRRLARERAERESVQRAQQEAPAAMAVADQDGAVEEARKVDLPLLKTADRVVLQEAAGPAGRGRSVTLTKDDEIQELREALSPR
jgi:hypothetical protein